MSWRTRNAKKWNADELLRHATQFYLGMFHIPVLAEPEKVWLESREGRSGRIGWAIRAGQYHFLNVDGSWVYNAGFLFENIYDALDVFEEHVRHAQVG